MLTKFQRAIGRRCQRFYQRTPNYSAYGPIGWLSLDRFVQGKNMMFLRTILALKEDDVCRMIFLNRALEFSQQN